MSEKRFTIKPQDDYWAVVDNHNEDKVCIINGIHTEIEAEWLCDFMNDQQDQINSLIVDKHILVDNIDKARLYIKAKDRHIKHQQATIQRLGTKNKELEKNFTDLVEWASEIAKRNVILDEKIGKLQRENKKLKEEEKLYAQEILRLNELLKQYQSFKDLGGDY